MTVRDLDAHMFDQVLKQLETTKQRKQKKALILNAAAAVANHGSDGSSCDSRNDDHFADVDIDDGGRLVGRQRHDNDRRIFETRQFYVDRTLGSPTASSVDSFIEKQKSIEGREMIGRVNGDEVLPGAILKLDRNSIPAPMHKNDVLVEIEAYTVDKRDLMIRPGVRCTDESLPQGVTTIGMDCIGRVVQLTNHARAMYGISIDDRIAAIYPFDYNTDEIRRNSKYSYALVDAGFVVAVPKHVDAAEAACMIRLYLSAFQSILMGIGIHKDRYGDHLTGQSILIENGHTDFGRALIELSALLGASKIFATGPIECHPLLDELGAVPLGAKTFSWELFLEANIGLVLVQEMPTEENFEQYMGILDETRGNMVYTYHGHKHDDEDMGNIGSLAEEVGCSKCSPQEITKRAQEAIRFAKFNLRLACSPNYIVYEGLWHSCKQKPHQFKEDLRYLFTLLGRGMIKPMVAECITLDDVAGVQDRIELLGNKGTVVCTPTALYEKKVCKSPEIVPRDSIDSLEDDLAHKYAVDAGYINDTLSDFHRMHFRDDYAQPMPVVREEVPYSYQKFVTFPNDDVVMNNSSTTTGSVERGHSVSQQEFMNHMSLLMGSNDQDIAGDVSSYKDDLQTKYSTIRTPGSIRFHKGKSRRYKAYHLYQRQKLADAAKRNDEQNHEIGRSKSSGTTTNNDLGCSSSFGTKMNDERECSSSVGATHTSARKMRRDSRKKEQSSAESISGTAKSDLFSAMSATETLQSVDEETTKNDTRNVAHSGPDRMKSMNPTPEAAKEVGNDKIKSRLSEYLSRNTPVKSDKQGPSEGRNEYSSGRDDESSRASSFQAIRSKWEQKAI